MQSEKLQDTKMHVTLGGLPQKIHIRTADESRPVILFLHGGPGVCNRHTIMKDHSDLCDSFTIVGWDQRGSGGSYKGCPPETLTIEKLTEDAAELLEFLCKRLNQKKIFIVGGSWGSELGIWLSKRFPERVAAFVGFGQVVNGAENERISFDFAYREAKKAGDEKSIKNLESVGPPVMGVYRGGFDGMMTQRRVMMKYGGYSPSKKKRSYFQSTVLPILKSGEYSLSELYGYIKGYKYVLSAMWPQVGQTDFNKSCTEFDIPIFIFDGVLDMNTPAELLEPWFKKIKAPVKELVWFQNSGHNPMNDEPEKFKKLLREKLLPLAEI